MRHLVSLEMISLIRYLIILEERTDQFNETLGQYEDDQFNEILDLS